jgi:hypothetical protein
MGIAAIDGQAVPATELTVMIFPERSCRMIEALPERETPVGGSAGVSEANDPGFGGMGSSC